MRSVDAAVLVRGIAVIFFCLAASAGAELAPITDEERSLGAEAFPGAPAVALFKKAEVVWANDLYREPSWMEVQVRIKVLTDEGREYGEVTLSEDDSLRLSAFEGRTVSPDGTVIELPKDAVFEQKLSEGLDIDVKKIAFPSVEIGSIVDYRYRVSWDLLSPPAPWIFHDEIPVRFSEIAYNKPGNLGVIPWGRETGGAKIQTESRKAARGTLIRAWMENLPALPDEPQSFPDSDLGSRFMLVPKELAEGLDRYPLFDSWKTMCSDVEEIYAPLRNRDRKAKKLAAELIAGASDDRARAEALFAWVRDEVRTGKNYTLWPGKKKVDEILDEKEGNSVGKALLLQAMLQAAKIDARLVWVADRDLGRIDLGVANPGWFTRTLVAATLGGERVFLDPSDPTQTFGHVSPDFEGTAALLFDKRKPETLTIPTSVAESHTRRAEVDLALDAEGQLTGKGVLTLGGHQAWLEIEDGRKLEDTVEHWQDWLKDAWPGFDISEVTVEESIDDSRVTVGWALAQREEAVLGDESSLELSRPLGPRAQIFTLAPEQRLTPVQFRFARRDDVEVRLAWPEGWQLSGRPEALSLENEAGAALASLEVDEAGRKLVFRRRFEVRSHELFGRDKYAMIREVYGATEKSDAQPVVLVRR